MKKLFFLALAVLTAAIITIPAQAQESLGDAARQMRMRKAAPPASEKVYTNDNLPTSGGLGVASASMSQTPPAPEAQSDNSAAASTGGKKQAKPLDPEAQREKVGEEWQKKIQDQQAQIDLLQRELSVAQREAQIRAAVFYADAGTQMRDPKKYGEDVRQSQADIDAKQKELDAAKQKLSDMQDEARKAGAPPSSYE